MSSTSKGLSGEITFPDSGTGVGASPTPFGNAHSRLRLVRETKPAQYTQYEPETGGHSGDVGYGELNGRHNQIGSLPMLAKVPRHDWCPRRARKGQIPALFAKAGGILSSEEGLVLSAIWRISIGLPSASGGCSADENS